jgi:hypothetical protein
MGDFGSYQFIENEIKNPVGISFGILVTTKNYAYA